MNFLKRCCESKRECLTYIIVTLWISIGILGTYYETNFTELAAYFISLTGFAGGRLPVKNLPDNLTGVLEPLPQGWAIGGGPKQGRGRQHPRLPFAPFTNLPTGKQRRRKKPIDHLPHNLMIDDDLRP